MERSFDAFARCLSALREREPGLFDGVSFQLYGTQGGWHAGQPKVLSEIAIRYGLDDVVGEEPEIVPYSRSVEIAGQSDGLIVLGVNDPGYMPSKLFHYAATQKPLIGCFCLDSQPVAVCKAQPELGYYIEYSDDNSDVNIRNIGQLKEFLSAVRERRVQCRPNIDSRFSGRAMARQHAAFFDSCVNA
jgi:hypothetical protein